MTRTNLQPATVARIPLMLCGSFWSTSTRSGYASKHIQVVDEQPGTLAAALVEVQDP